MTRALMLTCLLAVPASAAAPAAPEAGFAAAAQAFSGAASFAPRFVPRLEARHGKKKGPRAKAGRKPISLTGHVWLDGTAHVGPRQGWVTVTVSGSTQLRDQDGRYLNGWIRLHDTSSYSVHGSHVSGWARPYAYVDIYDNQRRYLGTVRVDGSIHVSGWVNGGWLSLRGSGTVHGSGTIDEN
jgi:hypothetical protein